MLKNCSCNFDDHEKRNFISENQMQYFALELLEYKLSYNHCENPQAQ